MNYLIAYYAQRPQENSTPDDIIAEFDIMYKPSRKLRGVKKFIEQYMGDRYPKPKWKHRFYKIYSPDGKLVFSSLDEAPKQKLITAGSVPADVAVLFQKWWDELKSRLNRNFLDQVPPSERPSVIAKFFVANGGIAREKAATFFASERDLLLCLTELAKNLSLEGSASR